MQIRRSLAPVFVMTTLAAAGAHAQSSYNLYGVVDLTLGSFQYSGTEAGTDNKRITKVDGNQMVTSYIGFKGVEDLGGGLKAGFVLESFLRPDTGASGRNDTLTSGNTVVKRADVFWGRASNVYLQSDLGKLTLGRQGNLLFSHALGYNPFVAAFGLSPTIRLTFGKWGNDKGDSGWSNALTYQTPNLGGFMGTVQAQFDESPDDSEKPSYAVGASYVVGPFAVGAAWQTVRSASDPMLDLTMGQRQNFGLLGVSYDFGVVKLMGQFGKLDNSGYAGGARIETTLYQLGASVPVTKDGKLLASFGQSKEKAVEGGTTPDTRHSILTVAYDHWLSKRTDLYVAVMLDDEKLPGFKKGTTYVTGMRHSF